MEEAHNRSNNSNNNNHNVASTIERDDNLVGTKDIFSAERSTEDKAQHLCNLCLFSSTAKVRAYSGELVCLQV